MKSVLSAKPQSLLQYVTTNSIRTRLILAFVGTILLTAVVISVSSIVIGFRTGQQRVLDELNAIARLKEIEIRTWANGLQGDLEKLATEEAALIRMRSLLQPTAFHDVLSGELRENFEQTISLSQEVDELFLLDLNGEVVTSSNPEQEGQLFGDQDFFQESLRRPFLQPLSYSPEEETVSIFISHPILHQRGIVLGVLVARVNIDRLNEIVVQQDSDDSSSHVYLVDTDKQLLTESPFPGYAPGQIVESDAVEAVLVNVGHGIGLYYDYRGTPVIGAFRWMPDLQTIILSERDQAQAFQSIFASIAINVGITIGAIALATVILILVMRQMFHQIDDITNTFNRIGQGDYQVRANVITHDELGLMATSLNGMLDNTLTLIQSQEERNSIQRAIQTLLDEVSDVAQGDLTVEAAVTPDMTGAIADAFNFMIVQLREIISNVQEATDHVTSAAGQIKSSTEQLSAGSEEQASQIGDKTAAIAEMTNSIQQVAENAILSATVAQQALGNAQTGAVAVQDTIMGMNRIRIQVQETAKRIKRLGERSQEITEIVQLIRGIAKRTSILALNASLEAAAAGEAGRGFAVVAEDVKRLAERSTNAIYQIEELVRAIQNETNEAVTAMEEGTREVVEGSKLADQAGQALAEIETVSVQLAELSQSISNASKQQVQGSEALAQSMTEIAQATRQTAAGTRDTAVSINDLALLANNLHNSVSQFKLPNGNGHVS